MSQTPGGTGVPFPHIMMSSIDSHFAPLRSPPPRQFTIDTTFSDAMLMWSIIVGVPYYDWRFMARLGGVERPELQIVVSEIGMALDDVVPPLVKWVPRAVAVPMLEHLIDTIITRIGAKPRPGQPPLPKNRAIPKPKPEDPDAWIDRAVHAMKKGKK